jgi:hypothetical protein
VISQAERLMHRKDVLVGNGDRLAALRDGTATVAGRQRRWSTVGVYDVVHERQIAGYWSLPLDQQEFDSIWSSRPTADCSLEGSATGAATAPPKVDAGVRAAGIRTITT